MGGVGKPETGRAIEVAKEKGKKNLFGQAIAVPFLNYSILLLHLLFLEIKEEKAKETGKLGIALVEEENNLCAQFSLFCRVSFTELITGSNS